MSQKCKCTSLSAIQVKKKAKFIVAYVQFVIMLIELKHLSVQLILTANNLKQGVFVCIARLPRSYWNELYQKLWMCVSYFLYCVRNKEIYCTDMYLYCIQLYRQYIYTLQVRMSISGVVPHYIEWGCQSPNPQEIHCFEWEFCVWFMQNFSGT
jgi:hypothetical protein